MEVSKSYIQEFLGFGGSSLQRETEQKLKELYNMEWDWTEIFERDVDHIVTKIMGEIESTTDKEVGFELIDPLWEQNANKRKQQYLENKDIYDKHIKFALTNIMRDWSKFSLVLKKFILAIPEFQSWYEQNLEDIKKLKKSFGDDEPWVKCKGYIKKADSAKMVLRMGAKKFAYEILQIGFMMGNPRSKNIQYLIDGFESKTIYYLYGLIDDHTYNHAMAEY